MWRGEREAFKILREKVDPNAKYVWFHAASLGEFEQGRPLMEQLRKDHPEYKILLTFFSPSGYEVRKNYEGADIITYLPLDTITNARRFLRTVRPVMAFFIKYEFWYNYLHILKHRGVPVYSVSSIFRPEQVFFKWYGRQYGRVLNCFTHFFVQNEISKELLAKIGITDTTVVGDTRFDRVLQIKEAAKQLPIVESFVKDAPQVFVAGSSWPPDEEIFIKYFNEHKNWKLIIAPHVIGEDHLKQIEKLLEGRKVIRYTEAEKMVNGQLSMVNDYEVLIINCFGLLSSIYHYGNVAYVGGGFGVGIHNLLEAAVWDVPVFFGPNNQKFQEAQGLKTSGGFEISSYEDFAAQMDRFAADDAYLQEQGQKAGHFVKGQSGATQKVLSAVAL
jgi:3-deoxy-D-manno-octulosonic-acid transferase